MGDRGKTNVLNAKISSDHSDEDLAHLRHDDVIEKRRRERKSRRWSVAPICTSDTEFGKFVSGASTVTLEEEATTSHRSSTRRHSQPSRGSRTSNERTRSHRRSKRKMRHIDIIPSDSLAQDNQDNKIRLKSSRRRSSTNDAKNLEVVATETVENASSVRRHGRRRSKHRERKSEDLDFLDECIDLNVDMDPFDEAVESKATSYNAESSSLALQGKLNRRNTKTRKTDFANGWIQLKSNSDGSVVTTKGRKTSRRDSDVIEDDVTYDLPSVVCTNSQTRAEMHMSDGGRNTTVVLPKQNVRVPEIVTIPTQPINCQKSDSFDVASEESLDNKISNTKVKEQTVCLSVGYCSSQTVKSSQNYRNPPNSSRDSISIDIPDFPDISEENSIAELNSDEQFDIDSGQKSTEPRVRRQSSLVLKWLSRQTSSLTESKLSTLEKTDEAVEKPRLPVRPIPTGRNQILLSENESLVGGDDVDIPSGLTHSVDEIEENVNNGTQKIGTPKQRKIEIFDIKCDSQNEIFTLDRGSASENFNNHHTPEIKNNKISIPSSITLLKCCSTAGSDLFGRSSTIPSQNSVLQTVDDTDLENSINIPSPKNSILPLFRCKTVIPTLPQKDYLKPDEIKRPKSWQANCLLNNPFPKKMCVDMSKILRNSVGDCFSKVGSSNNVKSLPPPISFQNRRDCIGYINKTISHEIKVKEASPLPVMDLEENFEMSTTEMPSTSTPVTVNYDEISVNKDNIGSMFNPTMSRDALAIDGASRDDTNHLPGEPYKTNETVYELFNQSCPNCWSFDTTVPWYMWNGKGLGWKVLMSPLLLLVGPFVWVASILHLTTRLKSCWVNCWRCDHEQYWFSCKGKGGGWICLLIPLYMFLGPLIIIFTVLTVILLACCGESKTSNETKPTERHRRTPGHVRVPAAFTEYRSSNAPGR